MGRRTDAWLRRRHSREGLVRAAVETRAFAETVPESHRRMYLQFALRYERLAREKGGTDPRTEQWLRLYDAAQAGASDEELRESARSLPHETQRTIDEYIVRRQSHAPRAKP